MPLGKDFKPTDPTNKGGADLEVEPQDEEESDDSDSYQLVRDRTRRVSKPTQRYGYADLINYALSTFFETTEVEPDTCNEAMKADIKRSGFRQ